MHQATGVQLGQTPKSVPNNRSPVHFLEQVAARNMSSSCGSHCIPSAGITVDKSRCRPDKGQVLLFESLERVEFLLQLLAESWQNDLDGNLEITELGFEDATGTPLKRRKRFDVRPKHTKRAVRHTSPRSATSLGALRASKELPNGLCGVNGTDGDEEDDDEEDADVPSNSPKTKSIAAIHGSAGKWSRIADTEPGRASSPQRTLRRAPVDPLNVSNQ
jgi:hypothetical protein